MSHPTAPRDPVAPVPALTRTILGTEPLDRLRMSCEEGRKARSALSRGREHPADGVPYPWWDGDTSCPPPPPPYPLTSFLALPWLSSEVPQWLRGVRSMKCVAFFSAWQLMSRRVMFTTSLMG